MPALFRSRLSLSVFLALTIGCFTSSSVFAMDLLQAYQLALQNDRQLRAAQAQHDAGIEALPQAASRLYPSLGWSSSRMSVQQDRRDGSTQFPLQRYPSQSDTLTLRQSLYSPHLAALKVQASSTAQSASATLQGEQQNLAVRVTEAYLTVLLAKERASLIQTQIHSAQSRLYAAQKQFTAGVGIRTDIDEIRAQLDVLLAQALQAAQTIAAAQSDLTTLTSQPMTKFFVVDGSSFQADKLNLGGEIAPWLELVLQRNNEVRYRLAQRDAAQASVDAAQTEDWPNVDALAQISRNSGENAYFVNSDTKSRTLGVQLNVPLYQGGWFSSRKRQALANLRESQEMLERAQLLTQNDAQKSYFAVKEGLARVAALQNAAASAQLVVTANQKSYRAGVRTSLDILAAEQRAAQVALDLAEARVQCLTAWVRVKAMVAQADENSLLILSGLLTPEK